jgi:hypothetical protein
MLVTVNYRAMFGTQFDLEQGYVAIGVTGRDELTRPVVFHHRYGSTS